MNENSLIATNYFFKNQKSFYRGKVRDVYQIKEDLLVMIACDRISAFDHVLPKEIPFKGQVLNQIASFFLDLTAKEIPNWKIATPDPNVTIGMRCDALPVEMVIRGYLAGHAWRLYKDGKREICGVKMPNGLKENDRLPEPIITPTTKAHAGHDEDISLQEILDQKLVKKKDLDTLVDYTQRLYQIGQNWAESRGLILVDTKYEFGLSADKKVTLIDEVHTPDSSRYFYKDNYETNQQKGLPQKQLSKEFVRQWLIENGFQGLEGQRIPEMSEEFTQSVTDRYIELFEKVTGQNFEKRSYDDVLNTVEYNINHYLESHP